MHNNDIDFETMDDSSSAIGSRTARVVALEHKLVRLRCSDSSMDQCEADDLEAEVERLKQIPPPEISAGECVPFDDGEGLDTSIGLRNTLRFPDVIAADASEARSRLAEEAGVLELALDAAATIDAGNSLEKMLAHQMALHHKLSMKFGGLALNEEHPATAAQLFKTSNAAARTYQTGLDTLMRVRRGGRQTMTVKHLQQVTVEGGAQAVIAGEVGRTKPKSRRSKANAGPTSEPYEI